MGCVQTWVSSRSWPKKRGEERKGEQKKREKGWSDEELEGGRRERREWSKQREGVYHLGGNEQQEINL